VTALWLLGVLLAGGLLAWLAGRIGPGWARAVALGAVGLDLEIALAFWWTHAPGPATVPPAVGQAWLAQVEWAWIPQLGIGFHLAMDGLSLVMILLTLVLGLLAIGGSWRAIERRGGLFHLNLLWLLGGVVGVFLAEDLFLFYVFWEAMLVPMVLLLGIWGHGRRRRAALRFFVFTQASGLLMLVSILSLAALHARATGQVTFDYEALLGTALPLGTAVWLMLGFFVAFAVKLPAVPLHTWFPDAQETAPTALCVTGLLIETAAYGLIRFTVPLFPEAALAFAPVAMALGAAAILYGALLALAQTDLRRLLAYLGVSHMGFVLVGVFAWNRLALQGVVLQMICQGLSTGGLFLIAGMLQERLGTRDVSRMGGLLASMPRMGAAGTLLAMAAVGLPGLGNFVAEFLTLLGAWQRSEPIAAVAATGMVASLLYVLRMVQWVFHGASGPPEPKRGPSDLSARELAVVAPAIGLLLWLGVHPQPVFDALRPTLVVLQRLVAG
jgi:NADH-quinone oxidoreductase subunit M